MTSQYSVVQYVPDPVADERINIGVVAVGEGAVRCRFVNNWSRAARFGGGDIRFLQEFARSIQESAAVQATYIQSAPNLDKEMLSAMAKGWINSIQLSEPRGSILHPQALVDRVAASVLKEAEPARTRARDRRSIVSDAERVLVAALQRRLQDRRAEEFVRRDVPFRGRNDAHQFDLAIANGHVYVGAYAVAFGLSDVEQLRGRVKIAGWDIADVRAADESLRLAVIASPPQPRQAEYSEAVGYFEQTRRICETYDVKFIPEDDLARQAEDITKELPFVDERLM